MRIQGRAIARSLFDGLTSSPGRQMVAGLTVGVAAVTVVQQTINTFGLDPALALGMLAGLVCGCAGASRVKSQPVATAAYLLAVVALWPFWLGALMDGVLLLPASIWTRSGTADVVAIVMGMLSIGVPAAVWIRCCTASTSQRSELAISLLAASLGALLQVGVFAPLWGLWIPAGVFAAIGLLMNVVAVDHSSSANRAVDSQAFPRLADLLLVAVLGVTAGEVSRVLCELWPVSALLWHVQWIAIVTGVALGCLWHRPSMFMPALLTGCVAVVAVILAPLLADFSLWMSCTLTSATMLEAARVATILAVLAPIGVLIGLCVRGDGPIDSKQGLWPFGASFAMGLVAARSGDTLGMNPVTGLIAVALFAVVVAVVILVVEKDSLIHRRGMKVGGLVAAAIGAAVWSGGAWDFARPARLLFSTHVFLAARTGWEMRLLSSLDDVRLMQYAPGRHGQWTLWQARGGEVQVRENGIPKGTLTTAPQWSPQFAPEVLPVVWPLVLVEQPARVLVLGARSGAALQAALVFPIREIICQEADAAVVGLIRGPIAEACGHDPFTDDRCRWVHQPEGWLAPVSDERFEVIVSQPATAALQDCAEEFTTEFYRRAAAQLAQDGVFCQRFSSLDFGPVPLLTATEALGGAFPVTACLEIGAGEFLLLGAWQAESLTPSDLPRRLEMPHVATLLARCQWDWSVGLNLAAYDRGALAEAAREIGVSRNDLSHGGLSFTAAQDLMRWAPKLQETAAILSKPRETVTANPSTDETAALQTPPQKVSRKSRYLEWLGPAGEHPAVLRRLGEVVAHQKLVQTFPDTYWWEYRRELREQLQNHPRTALEQVRHSDRWHSEDRHRKAYFEALGTASAADRPTVAELNAVESLLEPNDPLLTLFGHQELADLYARGDSNPVRELEHRLHVIYYAPSQDVSVRNVVAAIDHVVEHPATITDDSRRFDVLNGLLQTLRSRWEGRNLRPQKSAKVTLQEIDRSLLSVERAVLTLEPLAMTVGFTSEEWDAREEVLNRLLVKPFREYRDELKVRLRQSELKTRELLRRATNEG